MNTKKAIITAILALTLATSPIIASAAEDTKPAENKQESATVTGEIAASILSAYIWRGQELSRHSAVIQPSATVSYRGFSANIWGNLDTKPYAVGNERYSANYTETDVTLSYSHKVGIFQLGCGYIYYGLASLTPGAADPLDSQELFVSVGLDTILMPTLAVYKEIDHYHQWYATLGISHTFALHEKVGLKLSGNVSYLLSTDENTYPKYDGNGIATAEKFNNFHDGIISVSLPLNVVSTLTVTPTLSYVFPLSEEAKYEMRARGLQGAFIPSGKDSSSFLYGGMILSFSF